MRLFRVLLSVCLIFCMVAGCLDCVLADTLTEIETQEGGMVQKNTLNNIPVFITNINANINDVQEIKDASNKKIDAWVLSARKDGRTEGFGTLSGGEFLYSNEDCNIVEVPSSEKVELINNPLTAPVLKRACEIANSGVKLNYINLFVLSEKDGTMLNMRGDPDSEAYWESTCNYLCSYNGYKYLYNESAYSIQTNYVKPGNVNSSFNWGTFLQKSLISVASMLTGEASQTRQIASTLISNIVGSTTTPLSVTYGNASDSKLLTAVSGHVYIRTVFLQDKLDKFSGYAYYYYGSTEEMRVYQKLDAMIPTSKRTSTTYNYTPVMASSSVIRYATPGFEGTPNFAAELLRRYRYTNVYSVYSESFDTSSIVMSILS